MEAPSQAVSVSITGEKGQVGLPVLQHDATNPAVMSSSIETTAVEGGPTRKWKWSKTTLAFFLMGILRFGLTSQPVGLPTMPITTAANQMFEGITGVYGICLSLTAAISAFAGPMLGRYLPYNLCTIILTIASALAYVVCTLPQPLSNATGFNKAGPVIGTMMAGFVYAFGTQTYLAVAAFFPSESVVALSVGSGLSIILGSGVYIGLVKGPFDQDWRRAFLVFLPTVVFMPLIWWFLFDKERRQAAERSRIQSFRKASDSSSSSDAEAGISSVVVATGPGGEQGRTVLKPGFGPHRTRSSFLFKVILPKYVLPLITCTSCAIFSLFGLAPALQTLNRFKAAPEGELEFHLIFFAYGSAQFLFSTLVAIKPMPMIWIWTGTEIILTAIALVQLWHPFLTHFGVWFVVMFFVGGCVGGSVTNTNYKIAEDFRKAGEPDEVRSFANSYAGLGNFGGDAIGGALGLVIEQVVVKSLRPSLSIVYNMKETIVNIDTTTRVHEVPVPQPGPKEVLIKVAVAGTNPKDWKVPTFFKKEHNSGDDIAGVVDSVGDNVVGFRKGDRVAAFHVMLSPHGAFAEYAIAPAHTVFPLPASLSFEEAATIPLAAYTAVVALFDRLALPEPWDPRSREEDSRKERHLLVYGASTAVGAYSIKLASEANVHPIIAIGSQNSDFVRPWLNEAKGDRLLDYKQWKSEKDMIEAVQTAAKEANLPDGRFWNVLDCISEEGTFDVLSRAIAGPPRKLSDEQEKKPKIAVVLPGRDYSAVDASVETSVVNVSHVHEETERHALFGLVWGQSFVRGITEGWFKPHPWELAKGGLEKGVEVALRGLRDGTVRGKKMVIRVSDDQ